VLQALELFLSELPAKYPEVEQVLLFGSFSRGESVPGSDVDLLFILRESAIPLLYRIPRYMPHSFPVAVDVFPYTRDELDKMVADGNRFIIRALREGKSIYNQGDARLKPRA
jgi:predicted nucleotidyltransferase